MNIDSFFDWSHLATFSGAVAAVVFVVQFLKLPLDKIKHMPTRAIVYTVSFVIQLLAQLFTQQEFSAQTVVLSALNAVLVALAAMALYEQAISEPEEKKNAEFLDAVELITGTGQVVVDDDDGDLDDGI